MKTSRRSFLNMGIAATAAGVVGSAPCPSRAAERGPVTKSDLDRILAEPVLKTDFLKEPVTVASVELLRNGSAFLVRTRSTDGVEVITVPNPQRMAETFPIFLKSILPVFVKKDARTRRLVVRRSAPARFFGGRGTEIGHLVLNTT